MNLPRHLGSSILCQNFEESKARALAGLLRLQLPAGSQSSHMLEAIYDELLLAGLH
jgi:hypothetical protein